jgi:hypothetical protein
MAARSKHELRDASEHLAYEIGMFNAMADLLTRRLYKDTVEENAILESFTVHARVLVQFFSPSFRPHSDDVTAADYIASWRAMCGALPSALDKVNDRVAKEIAHLTYTRLNVTPAAKGWSITEMSQAMGSVIQKFANNVPSDSLGTSWPVSQSLPTLYYVASTTTPTVLRPTVVSSPSATNVIGSAKTRPPFDRDPT